MAEYIRGMYTVSQSCSSSATMKREKLSRFTALYFRGTFLYSRTRIHAIVVRGIKRKTKKLTKLTDVTSFYADIAI